jgi:hypothetical protein
MAIFCTFTSILVALVPETHGPTLLKSKNLNPTEKETVETKVKIRKVLGVYKQALKRPGLFFATGQYSCYSVNS